MTESRSEPRSRRRFIVDAASGGLLAATSLHSAQAQAQAPAGSAPFLLPEGFGVSGDGVRDDSAAIQRLVDAGLAEKRPIYFPAGNYRLRRPIVIRVAPGAADLGALAPGPKIYGAGVGMTVFLADFEGGAVFDLDTTVDHSAIYRASLGAVFEGFSISGRSSASGIRLRTAAQVTLRALHILGLGGTGIELVCRAGDNDGSNMVHVEQVRIENVRGWGIDAAGAEGFNEISFLSLRHVFVQNCGTAASGSPESGGMRWKGQICTLEQCAFTLNQNVALYVPGASGIAQSLDLRGVAFENNVGRHLLCTGITGFKGRNIQFYSNDDYRVGIACEFDGRLHPIRAVDIDGVVVRATAANRDQVAFRLGGTFAEPDRCRVRNVVWENYDHPGQHRFQGFLFDDVRQSCALRLASRDVVAFGPDVSRPQGNGTPLRLHGRSGERSSSSGEWIQAAIRSERLLSNEGLLAERTYWVYLYDDNGVIRLAAATSGPVVDRDSGYPVSPDDPSRLAVGTVRTDRSGGFEAVSPIAAP